MTVHTLEDLRPHIPAWDRLAWDASQKIPTLSPAWVDAFLRHRLKKGERWFCSFAYASDELVGVLPTIVVPHPVLGERWPLLHTPFDNETTPSCDILLAPEEAGAALQALLAEAERQAPNHIGLDLKAVRQGSPAWRALQSGSDGYVVHRGRRSMYSFLDVQGDFDTYLGNFSHMGRNLRRFRKKLERLGAVSVEIRKESTADENLLLEFLALEASGWKGRNGTAILNDHNLVDFYTTVARNFAMRGHLEWHAIRVNNRLVAAQMAVQCGATLILLKYAFDEDFADCRPGTLLTEVTLREAFSRSDLDEVNPMSDFDAHRLWHMSSDEYIDIHLVRRSAFPVLLQLPRTLYHEYVRPRIPEAVKVVYRKLKHPGDHKPRRAAEAAQLRQADQETELR
ncbi:GNAT family N-acetyltransferase [Microvirga aerophila]|uniref:GNAT family N-acetyltransferase n=1 Tax=Microvirga aerophila TaxID=670291 RepID=UPI001FEFBFBA|nr:GNAT family N-acetyltransferase [Microvirga aerophila]